jgi:4-diphosphocytidyl-2-C-methyl-D-erythritol kinase
MSRTQNSRRFRCYAKVNLSLRVLGRRQDGYHDIVTHFQSIALHDTLTIEPGARHVRLTCSDPDLPTGEENLVTRAAHLFMKNTGISSGVSMHLDKRIPVAAGLGGGSSNAAATLSALNELYGEPLSQEELAALALELGSDVPYFLVGGFALGRGRGELLEQLPEQPPMRLLLVSPPFSIRAADAYRYFNLTSHGQISDINSHGQSTGRAGEPAPLWHNDLERGVFVYHPEIKSVKDELLSRGAEQVVMSGSGPVVIARFGDTAKARMIANAMQYGEHNIILTSTLGAAEFRTGFLDSGDDPV